MPTLDAILSEKQNRIAFEELCRTLRRRGPKPIAMVGAGTSMRLGYPSWPGLLDRLDAEALAAVRDQVPPSAADYPDMLWRAQEYRRRMGEAHFGRVLQDIFKPSGKADQLLDDLVRLPFSHFITTNYDPALEEAHERVYQRDAPVVNWDDREEVVEFITRVADPLYRRRYVHLHGIWNKPQSIVLSDADYTRRYVQSDDTPKKLFAIFALRRFVFIGFSLSDPDLMAVLREVAARIGGTQARHFALVGYRRGENLEMHRNRFMGKFGVAPVFFDTTDDYEGLPVLVRALVDACGRRPEASRVEAVPEPAPVEQMARTGRPRGLGLEAFGMSNMMPPAEPFDGNIAQQNAMPTQQPVFPQEPAELPITPPADPNDPHKGRFGGSPAADGKVLRAAVKPTGDGDWFRVSLEVAAEPGHPALEGEVTFHLHPTFSHDVVTERVMNGAARLRLTAWGGFTVGAVTSDGTRLELDLAELHSAPMAFRLR